MKNNPPIIITKRIWMFINNKSRKDWKRIDKICSLLKKD